jgi:lysophospholipase L1-like esterase
MARSLAPAACVGLSLMAVLPAAAQAPVPVDAAGDLKAAAALPAPAEQTDPSLSPECRVPGSKLYTLASLRAVKRALREQRTVKVLAIGSSSTVGVGASSPLASYPTRLELELEKLFPGVNVDVENRGMSGEIAAGAAERMRNTIAEVQPDLVVWQVGTNDALARIDVEGFARALSETIEWIKSHKIDVVLVDPQYTKSLDQDEYFHGIVNAIQDVAKRDRVPLVQRYEAMRYLSGKRKAGAYLARDEFHLNDLGYRCMAEHVARAVTVSLLQTDPSASPPGPAPEPAVDAAPPAKRD